MTDYLVHFTLEAIGSLIALGAYKTHHCRKTWHKVGIWLVLSMLTTTITIQLVG